jgi:hypothetical protein
LPKGEVEVVANDLQGIEEAKEREGVAAAHPCHGLPRDRMDREEHRVGWVELGEVQVPVQVRDQTAPILQGKPIVVPVDWVEQIAIPELPVGPED